MSESEERAIRSAAVYEFEEAKRALALFRAKAAILAKDAERLCNLLSRSARDSSHLESAAKDARSGLERNLEAVRRACDVDSVLRFDDEMLAAIARFKAAQAMKKSLGYE